MTVNAQQFRLLVWVGFFLAACFTMSMYWDNVLFLFGGPVVAFLLSFSLARAAKVVVPARLIVVTILTYSILLAVPFTITDLLSNNYKTIEALGSLESWLCAYLMVRVLRSKRTPAPAAPKQPVTTHPTTPQPGDAAIRLDDPLPQQLSAWIQKYFPLPLSRRYAALAAAIRALEHGQDAEKARHAAEQAAKSWAPPPGAKLLTISDDNLATRGPWKDIPFEAVSQGIAIEAAVLRALELGKDEAAALAAARQVVQAWAPHPQAHTTPAKSIPIPLIVPSETMGVVSSIRRFTRPSIPQAPGAHPADRIIWSFTIDREGLGKDNQPLPSLRIQMEGARIEGHLEEGDIVQFNGAPGPGPVTIVSLLHNISRRQEVIAHPIAAS